MSTLWILLHVIAVYRITRLITTDTFPPVAWLRERLVRGRPVTHWLPYMLGANGNTGCPWCVSVWVAALGSGFLAVAPTHLGWVRLLVLIPAASGLTGLLTQCEELIQDVRSLLGMRVRIAVRDLTKEAQT